MKPLLLEKQAEILRRQIEEWAVQMMPITPIEDWGMKLARLLVDWAKDYDVIFTKQSLHDLQHWMLNQQKLALAQRDQFQGRAEAKAEMARIHEAAGAAAEAQWLTEAGDTVHFQQNLETGEFSFSVVPNVGEWVEADAPAPARRVLDAAEIIRTYKVLFGQNDPILAAFIDSGGSVRTGDVWGDQSYEELDGNRYCIWIEEDLDSPVLAAYYLRAQMLRVLAVSRHQGGMQWALLTIAQFTPDFDQAAAWQFITGARRRELENKMGQIKEAAEIIASVVNEGADLCITLNHLAEGDFTAAVGLLPFIPATAGKGGRILLRHGDVVLDISPDALRNLRRAGIAGSTDELIEFLESTARLARNMEKAGIPRPPNTQAHHIVASGSNYRAAAKARAILDKYKISVENVANGVYLPTGPHRGMHTKAYYKAVASRLARVRSRAAVIEKLDVIRYELLRGTFRAE